MITEQNYPNWPAKGEIPTMGVPRKLTEKEVKMLDEMMHGNKDTLRIKEVMESLSKDIGKIIWMDEASSLPSITLIKIPRKLKKKMKKEGNWNNTLSFEVTDLGIKARDKGFWIGL